MAVLLNRVSMKFTQNTDSELVEFANGVVTGMNAPAYSAAPMSTAQLQAYLDDFVQKLAASRNGGRVEIAEKNVARATLLSALRQNANFVQMIAETDLPLLLESGYTAVSTNRTSGPLTKPVITRVDNLQSTIMMIGADADVRSRAMELRFRTGAGDYKSGGVHTKAKRMMLEGVIPGTMVELQTRSVGGTLSYSDWSDPVTHMAT